LLIILTTLATGAKKMDGHAKRVNSNSLLRRDRSGRLPEMPGTADRLATITRTSNSEQRSFGHKTR